MENNNCEKQEQLAVGDNNIYKTMQANKSDNDANAAAMTILVGRTVDCDE